MLARVITTAVNGMEAIPAEFEVNSGRGAAHVDRIASHFLELGYHRHRTI